MVSKILYIIIIIIIFILLAIHYKECNNENDDNYPCNQELTDDEYIKHMIAITK